MTRLFSKKNYTIDKLTVDTSNNKLVNKRLLVFVSALVGALLLVGGRRVAADVADGGIPVDLLGGEVHVGDEAGTREVGECPLVSAQQVDGPLQFVPGLNLVYFILFVH